MNEHLMDKRFNYWKLAEELSITEAALLTVWCLPEEWSDVETRAPKSQPEGYLAVKRSIVSALRKKKVDGRIVPLRYEVSSGLDNSTYFEEIPDTIDFDASTLDVDSLAAWLEYKGNFNNPFVEGRTRIEGYLDYANVRYAPKLAAAVKAWEALEDQFNTKLSPKQNLQRWLRLHAAEYGFVNDDGKPRESTIEDIAKIANWSQIGGAPKVIEEVPMPKIEGPREDFSADLDDEIPF